LSFASIENHRNDKTKRFFFRFSARRVYKPETSGTIEPVPASANLSTSGRIVPQVLTLFFLYLNLKPSFHTFLIIIKFSLSLVVFCYFIKNICYGSKEC
jgi:hypothetical protein